jgi:hypothetical protein
MKKGVEVNWLKICLSSAKYKVFMAVKIEVEVSQVVTPCSAVVGYHHLEDLAASILRVKQIYRRNKIIFSLKNRT